MANQLQKGSIFADGQIVNAALLNNLVDLAVALEGIISVHAPVTPVGTDYVLLLRPGSPNTLQKAVISNLPSGLNTLNFIANPVSVFGVSNPNPGGPVTTVTLTLDNQSPNKFLAGPVTGAAVAPLFRTIAPSDTASLIDIAALTFDFTRGNFFRKVLHGGLNHLRIDNGIPGQVVTIVLVQGDAGGPSTVDYQTDDPSPAVIRWATPPGHHTMSTGLVSLADIVTFRCTDFGQYYGTFDKNFVP
jgi:hypothetical protein